MRNPLAVVFSAIFLVFTLFAPTLYAEQHRCTTANIAGTYGYEGFGNVTIAFPFFNNALGAYSSVGTLTFDGKGDLHIVDYSRVGDFSFPKALYEATYEVEDPNQCIVNFTLTAVAETLPGPHYRIVFVDNRNKALGMSLIPGIYVNFVNTTKIATDNQQ